MIDLRAISTYVMRVEIAREITEIIGDCLQP